MEQTSPPTADGRRIAATLLALSCGLLLAACGRSNAPGDATTSPPAGLKAQVARTSHGVVHVQADDFRGLGYGLGYAYAQDNLCMFADSLLTARGERSESFGPEAHATKRVDGEYGAASDFMDLKNEDSDFFFKGYLDPAQLQAGFAASSQEARDYLVGYVAGYNRYLKERAGNYPAACANAKWVRPITVGDMHLILAEKALHASGEVFAAEIVAAAADQGAPAPVSAQLSRAGNPTWVQARLTALSNKLGSNALALGKDVTSSGKGILLGNPHYPWTSTDRFYQAHLTVPGNYDVMGVILGGIPLVVIGFNKDVAWTHTVTAAVHFTTFKLALDPTDPTHTTYLTDGAREKLSSRTVTVSSLQPDGRITKRSKTFYFSKHGSVLINPEAGVSWTPSSLYVLADPNRNNTRLLDQWIAIGRSASVHELKAALDSIVGLPWVNTVATDRDGNALYADASVVPRVGPEKFMSDCLVAPALLAFDGSRSACGWGQDAGAPAGIFAPGAGPWAIRSDYVGNSNDSYWLTNARALMTGPGPSGFSPLYGPTGIEQKLRTRIGFKQLEELLAQRRPLALGDVQQLAFANRVYAAELVLPQFLPACTDSADRTVAAACAALTVWDRKAELDSRGAVLFREFWNEAANIPGRWETPLDPRDPVNTPNGVAPGAMPAMLAALKNAGLKLQALNIPLDARLGDFQGDTRNGVRVPIHGAIGDIDGSYNSIHMAGGLDAEGYHDVAWGTSYVQAVTFDGSGPVAQAMLLYGQSTDPKSAWYADQVPLYSRKQWTTLPFSPVKIKADPNYKVQMLEE
jgi:acyl-homoserine-lactone acylase